MLKTRIIPTLLWDGSSLVKGTKFDSWRRLGPVLPLLKIYLARHVDEVILLNIATNKRSTPINFEELSKFLSICDLPICFGGGINSLEQIDRLMDLGVDKISINTGLFRNKYLLRDCARKYGTQFVVVSIDVKKDDSGEHICFSENGSKNENKSATDWAIEVEQNGAGEILLTSIENDGMFSGYDLELVNKISNLVSIPVIASGGAKTCRDFEAGLIAGAHALAAASCFQFTELTPKEVKKYLKDQGYCMRR